MNSRSLEVRCAQLEQQIQAEILAVFARACDDRRFPRMAVSPGVIGAYPTTIKYRAITLVLSGCTTLGNPITLECEVCHDDFWVPVVTVSSTETEEPQDFVVGRDLSESVGQIVAVIEQIICLAAARSKYERDHLPELLEGRTEFTIYE